MVNLGRWVGSKSKQQKDKDKDSSKDKKVSKCITANGRGIQKSNAELKGVVKKVKNPNSERTKNSKKEKAKKRCIQST
jgi:hypothetical protein